MSFIMSAILISLEQDMGVIRITIPDTFGLDAMLTGWRYFCRTKVGSTNPLGVSSLPVVSNLNLHLFPP